MARRNAARPRILVVLDASAAGGDDGEEVHVVVVTVGAVLSPKP